MSSSSSAAVLTESFDFDLHLENDKPVGFFNRLRLPQMYAIAFCILLSSMVIFSRSALLPRSSVHQLIEVITPQPIVLDSSLNIRLKAAEELNAQIMSRISKLNDSVNSLRSRVFDIEKKPISSISENITSIKDYIEDDMRELVDRLAEQSDNLYRLEEVHETARNQLNELGEVHTQEISKHASQVESVTDKLAEFNNRLDAALLIRAERTELTTVRAVPVPLSTCPVIDDSKLKSQNAFLQQKITNLEGKFSALVQESDKSNDAAVTTEGDTSITLGGLKCSPSQVENIVTNEWNKNIEIYRKFNPVITCPVTPILPPTIVEKFVEKIVIKNVVKIVEKNLTTVVYRPAVAATPVVLSPDYARKQAGSEIIHESSSHTYTPREMDFWTRISKYS